MNAPREPLKILGSKARLQILKVLSRRDMYVSEIMDQVGMDGKTAKHHLQVLEENGIVSSRIEGRRKYYSMKRGVELHISPSPQRRYEVRFPRQEGDSLKGEEDMNRERP